MFFLPEHRGESVKATNLRRFFLSTSFLTGCLFMMFAYQNCGNDASFSTNPSADRNRNANGNGGGTIFGGNSDIVIQVNEYPVDSTDDNGRSNTGGSAVVDFEVNPVDPNVPITQVTCLLDGVQIACNPVDRIPINNLPIGDHSFEIIATNEDGQQATHTITWTVYDRIVQVTRDISVNVVNDKADIMIIVDNSGSMQYEQRSMASRIGNMINRFAGLDYRISVITTSIIDLSNGYPATLDYVDGKFQQFDDGSYCVSPNSYGGNSSTIQSKLGDIVQRSETGSPWERGVYTSYRAIERYQAGEAANCFRNDGTAKHFILISDETETIIGDGRNGQLFNIDSVLDRKHISEDVNHLKNKVAQVFGAQTVFKFHSIIVDPTRSEGQDCLNSHGAKLGVFYGEMSGSTGGIIGTVCAQDYAGQMERIGQSISDSAKSYKLACVAIPNDQNEMGSVVTLPGNNDISIGWGFNGDNVEFDSLLPAGDYRVTHYCFQ